MKTIANIIIPGLFLFSLSIQAQTTKVLPNTSITGDSLSLAQIIKTVINEHPSVKEAEEVITIADARIGLARSGYYPNVDASISYSRVGPTPPLAFQGMDFHLIPADNYNGSLNYSQVLYDFGKTRKNVGLENENKVLAVKKADLVKQKLSLLTANTFYMMVFLQEAIQIKDKELQALKEHQTLVEKKRATGSATQYESLTTKVKISATESQKLDLETSLKVQQTTLKSLMGLPVTANTAVKQEYSQSMSLVVEDSLLSYAFTHRLEMDVTREKESITGLQYQLVKSQNNPVLSAFASGGGKNGYVPELNQVKLNFVAGVGFKVPLFDGHRMKYNLIQSKSDVNNASFETEISKRNITNEEIESEASCVSAMQKIKQNELQLSLAEEAFSLAKVNFGTGAITNLDLLDAENVVSESRLMLLKSRVDYAVSTFKLNVSLGNKMF